MKAESYINKKTGQPQFYVNGWYASEKFDGQRAQWRADKKQLISRYYNTVPAPEWFIKPLLDIKYPLDGELFVGYGNWDLTGIFRSKSRDSCEKNKDIWKKVTYIVFDIADPELGDYNERFKILENIASSWTDDMSIYLIKRTLIGNKAELATLYDKILSKGGEGVMLNNAHSFYRDGRCDVLLKYKPVMDEQCIIVGYKEGKGRNHGHLGSFIVHPIEDGEIIPSKEFSISGINDTVRAGYLKSHPVGTVINYRCCDFTKSGKPRHPTYLGKCRKIVMQIPEQMKASIRETPSGPTIIEPKLKARPIPKIPIPRNKIHIKFRRIERNSVEEK